MSTSFRSLALSPALLAVLDELGFAQPTAIQERSIPRLLEGRDLVGRSQTGSGKTAAFLLPLLEKLSLSPRRMQGLVLCPTRELCAQVAREARTLGRRLPGLQVLVVAGGQTARPQVEALARGVHLVVGTPGRVLDLLARGAMAVDALRTVVLDEADRMLDMGFEQDMRAILKALPDARQTILFSATFPSAIDAMSARFQRDPVRVTIDDAPSEVPDIVQLVHRVEPADKPAALLRLLRHHAYASALVFCNFKASASELERTLRAGGVRAEALHGDLEQFDRDRVMAKFRNGTTRVLLATDVAARGIDVASVDLVVNYELPPQVEVYVHRIGRTGRAGKSGLAIALASERDGPKLDVIARTLGRALEVGPLPPETADATASDPESADAARAMLTLYVSGGRKEKVRPGDLLGALTGEACGLGAADVGKIEIHDHFSYVAVDARVARTALRGLSEGRIKGRKFRVGFVD